ncbi:MAG TPA: tripartite tricarboxylate transporter substrate binding protein [Burkholderiales bacterium]|nr:tripartite tricarboxylate transporter substrate binding protein [Burkholderiales bacterium]
MGAAAALRAWLAAALLAHVAGAFAQSFPAKPVRVVVAFSPGGVTDIIARTLGARLADLWGQSVVVENRPGAGGSIGAVAVAKAPADGYTLLVHSSGYAINAALNPALPYDPRKDLVEVAPLGSQPMVLVVSPAAGIGSVRELIVAAKERSGGLAYGSSGIGSGAHMNGEKFRFATGAELLHVPYKGGAEAINDTIAQRLAFTFNTVTLALPHIRDGRLRALGVSSARRSALLPEVPTIAEAGVPGFEFSFWNGLWAPAGTPTGVVERIAADVRQAFAQPDMRERLTNLGAEPMDMTPAQFSRFVQSEIEDAARIGKAAGIRLQ